MNKFYHASPIIRPEDVIPHLAMGERHWKKGRSAYELAYAWVGSDGFPDDVSAVLEMIPAFAGATLIEGLFEKETDLETPGRPSQTDLLVLCRCAAGIGVIGVEGKVDEPFGEFVRDWLRDGSPGKQRRLAHLLEILRLEREQVMDIRYQLLHRTVAAFLEARRYGADIAMMLVHSFSPKHAGYDDFSRFAELIGAPVSRPGSASDEFKVAEMPFHLGWVTSEVQP